MRRLARAEVASETKGPNERLMLTPGIERVQALAGISRSALCCHSNETRAPIANPPNTAQLQGTHYHSFMLHPGPYSSVGMRDGQTDRPTNIRRDTQTAVANTHFASAMPHAKYNKPTSARNDKM